MPNVLLDRISLPNLRLYTSVSVVLVSCCLYYAISATSDPFWRLDNNTTASDSFFSLNTDSQHVAEHVANGPDLSNILTTDKKDTADAGSILTGWNGMVDHNVQQQPPSPSPSPHQHQVVNQIFSQFTADQRKMFNDTRTIGTKFKDVVSFMVQEPICVWVSTFTFSISLLFFFVWIYLNSAWTWFFSLKKVYWTTNRYRRSSCCM